MLCLNLLSNTIILVHLNPSREMAQNSNHIDFVPMNEDVKNPNLMFFLKSAVTT